MLQGVYILMPLLVFQNMLPSHPGWAPFRSTKPGDVYHLRGDAGEQERRCGGERGCGGLAVVEGKFAFIRSQLKKSRETERDWGAPSVAPLS